MSNIDSQAARTTRRCVAPLALLLIAWFPCAVRAFTFTRVGDGSQTMTSSWAISGGNCTTNGSCGNETSIDGRIPLDRYSLNSSGAASR